jgi:hypothetical protein
VTFFQPSRRHGHYGNMKLKVLDAALMCAAVVGCVAASVGCSGNAAPSGAGSVDGGLGGAASNGGGAASNGGSAGTTSGAGSSSIDGGGSGALGTTDPSWTIPEELQLCDGPCACADGIDNDGDGDADGFDVECTGPGDDDEGTFATGISGDNVDPKWQDCFFDGNSGAGDDGCRYATGCLTGELEQADKDCTLSQACIDFCKARTPNGCDCFGCCEIAIDGDAVFVVATAGCDLDKPETCTTCVQTTQCENTCGECELCPGKGPDDLPDSCGSSGTAGSGGSTGTAGTDGTAGTTSTEEPPIYTCDNGEDVCRSNADCQGGSFCSFGCCLPIPPT